MSTDIIEALGDIESAINGGDSSHALEILQTAREMIHAEEPDESPLSACRELDRAEETIDEIDSFVHVCEVALRSSTSDASRDVIVVLGEVYNKLRATRECVRNALGLLSEVQSNG